MKPALLVIGACVGLLAGALLLSHVISSPDPVTVDDSTPAVKAPLPVAAPAPVVAERVQAPAPGAPPSMQRPEFDAADAVLADANASSSSVRDAFGLFQRCVQYEPANARCVASLKRAQDRVAGLPPEPAPVVVAPEPVAVQQPAPVINEAVMRRRSEISRMRAMPAPKGGQFLERMKLKPEEK